MFDERANLVAATSPRADLLRHPAGNNAGTTGAKGSLVIERSWDGGAHWATLGLKRPKANGHYSYRFRVKGTGNLTLRVT